MYNLKIIKYYYLKYVIYYKIKIEEYFLNFEISQSTINENYDSYPIFIVWNEINFWTHPHSSKNLLIPANHESGDNVRGNPGRIQNVSSRWENCQFDK